MTTKTNDNLTSPPRQRTSVAIQGIDRSTPDDLVTDGKCEELHNLRYQANAWRPVHPHKEKIALPAMPINYKVVYNHPATDDKYYIVEALVNGKYYYYNFDSSVDLYNEGLTLIASFDAEQRVSHFGNVLFIGDTSFLLKEGAYVKYDASDIYPDVEYTNIYPTTEKVSWDYFSVDTANITLQFKYDGGTTVITLGKDAWYPLEKFLDAALSTAPVTTKFRFMRVLKYEKSDVVSNPSEWPDVLFPTYINGYWSGEHAMFAVLRMQDGSYLNPSPVVLNCSQNYYEPIEEYRHALLGNVYIDGTGGTWPVSGRAIITKYELIEDRASYSKNDLPYYFICPCSTDVKVSIPSSVDRNLVQSIALFSTRCFPLFDEDVIKNVEQGFYQISKFYKDNSLLASQFYKVKEVEIKDCTIDNANEILYFSSRITASIFEELTSNLLYEPTISNSLKGNIALDFNNRLHLADVTSAFNSAYFTNLLAIDDDTNKHLSFGGVIETNNKSYISMSEFVAAEDFKDKFKNILSAHDVTISKFLIITDDTYTRFIDAKHGVDNNIAYYIAPSTDSYKFPDIRTSSWQKYTDSLLTGDADEPNRIQVSAPNNPFSFPFENSYAVGSANNRILAMQSAAIEISDEKIGEHPLYVFTEEGIFALRAGSETLYARVDAINYDKIINPNTLAINGAIVYITEKGVHLLQGMQSTVISTPIHGADGMPPLDFLRTCKIIWPKQYNEIVLFNEDGSISRGVAYVFNIDAGYWSTRSLDGVKLNTDELYSKNIIYDLGDEDESMTLHASILTRPIKLGNVEFKRAETIIPRMNMGSQPAEVIFNINGSVNGTDYMPLRHHSLESEAWKNNPIVIRRTPFSAKYFEVELGLSGNPLTTAITHIDFEWYQRFRHRMR